MDTLQDSKLKAALAKAKNVGRVEEAVTIAGCAIVLQSLSPDEYEAINEETKGLEEMAYLHAYQVEHLARSIVEIEGIDLRGTRFIEVDGDDGKKIKHEKHAWLRDEYLRSWSREAIITAWRKMMEVFAKADDKAKEGIQFSIAEETDEGRFRRFIGEMKEAAGELPDELVFKILDDEGLLLKSSKAELDAVNESLKTETPEAAPPVPAPTPPIVRNPNPTSASLSPDQAEALMRNRVPLNQQAIEMPSPQSQVAPVVVPASRRAQVPPEIRDAAVPVQSLSRAERPPMPDIVPPQPEEIVEIKRATLDTQQMPVIDAPPTAGINTRYQPRRP